MFPIKSGQIDPGLRHQCDEPGDEVQRLEDDVGGSISVRRLELVTHVAIGRERQPLFRHRRPCTDAIVPKRLSTLHPCSAM